MSKFGLLFLLVLSYGCYLMLTTGPVVGIYLYELVYFLRPDFRWWGAGIPSLSYSFLIIIFTFLMYVVHIKKVSKTSVIKQPEFRWLGFMMLVYIGVSLVAVNKGMHKTFLIELLKSFVILFLFIKLIDNKEKLHKALAAYLVGCAYIGWEAYRVGRNAQGRVEGIGVVDAPDSNGVAATMVAAIPIMVYFFWRMEWKWKICVMVLGALIANGLVLINSRGAFLGAAAGAGFIFLHLIFSKYKLPKQKLMVTLMLVAGAVAVVQVTDKAFWDRMYTIKTTASKDSEGSGGKRINYWLATFDMVEDYPLGLGIYGYQTVSPLYLTDESYFETYKHDGVKVRAVHSMWFQALSEIGWVGVIAFFMALARLGWRQRQMKKFLISENRIQDYYLVVAIQAGLLSFLVAGTFIDAFRHNILYWFIGFCIITNMLFHPDNQADQQTKAAVS